MKIAIINGANLNMLGIREIELYGTMTYQEMISKLQEYTADNGIEAEFFQSNHEGEIIDYIHSCYHRLEGIVINAGAYSHTSLAIMDALLAVSIPTVEVHLTDTGKREIFRRTSFIRLACLATYQGEGLISYQKAIRHLIEEAKK